MEEKNRILSEKFIRIHVLRGLFMHKAMKGKELFKGQYPILAIICENEGCSQKFLADQLMVSPASIALSVKRLCKAGMIHKDVDENNLRCNRIYSTEKGRMLKDHACELHKDLDERSFAGFSEEEKIQMSLFFDRILENLQGEERELTLYALHDRLNSDDE